MSNYWHDITFISSKNIIPSSDKKGEFIDQETGEVVKGFVGDYASFDSHPFVKTMSDSVYAKALMSSAGRTIYFMVEWLVQQRKDSSYVFIDKESMDDYISFVGNSHPDFSIGLTTLYRGINNMLELDFIRKGRRQNEFQVNPQFIFNGSRLRAFKKEKDFS